MTDLVAQITIDLSALQGVSLRRLQRLMDILRFIRAAASSLEADDGNLPLEFYSLNPAVNAALSPNEARSESESWATLHCLRDAIDVAGQFLEESRRCCALYRLSTIAAPRLSDIGELDREGRKFHSLGLPKKIEHVQARYGVASEYSGHVVSLNAARNCLVHRLGVVSEADVDEDGTLSVLWADIRVEAASPDSRSVVVVEEPREFDAGWSLQLVIEPTTRIYRIGDHIHFTYRELLGALFSHQLFINTLTLSVQQYAESLGFQFAPVKAEA